MDFFREVEMRSQKRLDDDDRAPVPFEPEWRTRLQRLRAEDKHINEQLAHPHLGSTQIRRATLVFKALVLASEHEDWSDPGLQDRVFGHMAGSQNPKINYDKGVRELVRGGVKNNLTESKALSWFFDHLEWILRFNGKLAMDEIMKSHDFSELKDTRVPSHILKNYCEGVRDLVHSVQTLFENTAWMKSEYVPQKQVEVLKEFLKAIPRAHPDQTSHTGESLQSDGSSSLGKDDDDEFQEAPEPPKANAAMSGSRRAGMEDHFMPSRDVPPPRTGLPGDVISSICNPKPEGTPGLVSPFVVCKWIREAYFFKIIDLLGEVDFLVNSKVVLEVNEDVGRKRMIDDAITKVQLLTDEELDKLREFDRAAVQMKQDEEEVLLGKITADHANADKAIATLQSLVMP